MIDSYIDIRTNSLPQFHLSTSLHLLLFIIDLSMYMTGLLFGWSSPPAHRVQHLFWSTRKGIFEV